MIWDYIRDFIVQYITGGFTSEGGYFSPVIGELYNASTEEWEMQTTDGFGFSLNEQWSITLGDWLATTLTIIAMCLIAFFAYWLVRWVFKAVSSAFLLRR